MNISITKNVSQVDMGTFGKKNLSLEIKFQPGKKGWELHCWFCYVILNDGKMSPVHDNVISKEFITKIANEALDEIKAISEWTFR